MATKKVLAKASKTKTTAKSKKVQIKQPFYKNAQALLLVALVLAAFGAYWMAFSNAGDVGYVATHPQAVTQPTTLGKSIQALYGWRGKLYTGYGDMSNNTGPISVTPFDPATNTFAATPEGVVKTEVISQFVEVNGKLYAPSGDPRGADYAVGTPDPATGVVTWVNKSPVGMAHVFDFVQYGNELCMIGSKSIKGVVYCGTDDGPWRVLLEESPINGTTGAFTRIESVVKLNNKLYVQARDYDNPNGYLHQALAYDGVKWSNAPALTTSWAYDPVYFNGKALLNVGGGISSYDGVNPSREVLRSASYFTVGSDGYVYAVQGGNTLTYNSSTGGWGNNFSGYKVIRSNDLVNWTTISFSSDKIISIAYFNNRLYFGTSDAKLYSADTTPSRDTVAPTVSITSPTNGETVYGSKKGKNSGTTYVKATATDNDAIKKVELYVDDTLVGTSTSGNASIAWQTSTYPNGLHRLTMVAYDTAGNSSSSDEVSVSLNESVVISDPNDKTPPLAKINQPFNGSTISGRRYNISAKATDNVQVARAELKVDGVILYSGNKSDITVTWNIQKITKGLHNVTLDVYDSNNNKTSTASEVIVQ